MLSATPPTFDQLEVTVIGPGYGECIVIHAEGEWTIVDSCRDARNKKPAAAEYLSSIGVTDPSVKLIACTHWHDDHISGLADLYEHYMSAEFSLSGALKNSEFTKVIEILKDWHLQQPLPLSSGTDELGRVLTLLQKTSRRPKFAIANRQIWQSSSGLSRLVALSPSDETTFQSAARFSSLIPNLWTDQIRAADPSPNHIAVAMHLTAGAHSVLLGSDLEEHGNPLIGWSAIVTDSNRPQAQSNLYKVAHHGSVTAEHPGIWTDLLSSAPVSVMSPFSKSTNPLPTQAQQQAIRARSSRAFLTADLQARALKRRGPVARFTSQNNLRLAQPNLGWVRARISMNDPQAQWLIEYAGEATEIS